MMSLVLVSTISLELPDIGLALSWPAATLASLAASHAHTSDTPVVYASEEDIERIQQLLTLAHVGTQAQAALAFLHLAVHIVGAARCN